MQVSQLKADLSAAKAAAASEVKRAAALQQDLEHLQEQAAHAAAATVEGLVEGLTQGQETEDETEQPPEQQRRPRARASAAAAARRKKDAAVAATPAAQTAVFSVGPVAALSGIEEGDEEHEGMDEQEEQQLHPQERQSYQQQQEQGLEPASVGGARRPRSAKFKAQAHIKAAAAADITPPSSEADPGIQDSVQPQAARRVSPRNK